MWGPIMLVLHGFHAFNKRYKIYKKLFFLGLIYLAFRPVTLTADFTKTFKGMICHKIRDFMADFSNSQILNPEVIKFKILSESRETNADWSYEVYYEEYFENLPAIFTNSATGRYHVFQESKDKKDFYFINSTHLTCMISNYFCLETHGSDMFHVKPKNDSFDIWQDLSPWELELVKLHYGESIFYNWGRCILEETIEYQCPTLLIPLCMSEVNKQRPKVLDNLKTYLQSRKKYKISHQLLEGIKQKLQND